MTLPALRGANLNISPNFFITIEIKILKKYLALAFLFAFIGCSSGSISYEPVTQPDQRISFQEFSFLPPNGEKWRVASDPMEIYKTFGDRGRSFLHVMGFKKIIFGNNRTKSDAQILRLTIAKYDFEKHKFDNEVDLMEFADITSNDSSKQKRVYTDYSQSQERLNRMKCVWRKGKSEGSRRISSSKSLEETKYFQGYICVHPKNSNILIELHFSQAVIKGRPKTDRQSEINPVFDSLEAN